MGKSLFNYNKEWKELSTKFRSRQTLSEEEKAWYFAQSFLSDVSNGGIISFFYNYGADHYDEVVKALIKLNVTDALVLLEKVNNLFPGGVSSKNIDERNAVIGSWSDGQYNEFMKEIDEVFCKEESTFEETVVKFIEREGLV